MKEITECFYLAREREDRQLIYHLIWNPETAVLTHVRLKPIQASLPGDHRDMEPPDPIPNSVVKRALADGSVGFAHVRVGHRQASN